MADSWPVRTALWADGAAGRPSILFVNGRADFIEKYSEAFWEWRAAGHALASFDWRGQGMSGRLARDPDMGHVDDFSVWCADLDAMVTWARTVLPGPLVLVAHSMGGHLVMRYLAERAARGQGDAGVAGAVLLAPMMGIASPGKSLVIRMLTRIACLMGRTGRYAVGQYPYGAHQRRPARGEILTGSAERFADEGWWNDRDPGMSLGGVSWGWLDAAFRSIAALKRPGVLEAIRLPVMTLVGRDERLVEPESAMRACARMPQAECRWIAAGRHELLRDADMPRRKAMAAITAFLDRIAAG